MATQSIAAPAKTSVERACAPASTALAVVIVTYNSARHIGKTLSALLDQLGPQDELVVVDNASTDATVAVVSEFAPDATVLELETNTGFTGGCNLGAQATEAPLLLFLNPDAKVSAGCIDALRATAGERPGWGAWQALVTLPGGKLVNTSGGVTHFLGFAWAGECGKPVELDAGELREIGFSSGAALVVRREAWSLAGGFDEDYFMYGEDVDLSLRLSLAGHAVGVTPAARVEHDYEFAKGPHKWFYLERNRWATLLATYPWLLLALLSPALLLSEVALLAVAARRGWLVPKLRAQAAVIASLPRLLSRRRRVQALRAVSARQFAERLCASLDNPYLGAVARFRPVAAVQHAYWRAVMACLSLPRARQATS